MPDYPIAIMYVASLGFAGFMAWLYLQYRGIDSAIKAEIVKLRQEVNALNMAQGMKTRAVGPPQYHAPTVGGT
jgi:hypothetical protein